MNANTKSRPLSRRDIRKITNKLKVLFDIPLDKEFPVMLFMEHCLDELGFEWDIVDDYKIKGSYAEAIPQKHLLKISLQTYDGARTGNPRDKFTIAHEIGHLLLHIPDYVVFTRANENIKPYENPEWQANTFAGELLVHTDLISGMSVREITERYGVSFTVAKIQLENA